MVKSTGACELLNPACWIITQFGWLSITHHLHLFFFRLLDVRSIPPTHSSTFAPFPMVHPSLGPILYLVPSLRVVESSDWAMCHGPVKSTSLLLFMPNFANQEHLDFGRCSSATLDFSSRLHLSFLSFCSLIPCAFPVIYYVLQLIRWRCTTTMCGSHR
jgi:hypothetical protein